MYTPQEYAGWMHRFARARLAEMPSFPHMRTREEEEGEKKTPKQEKIRNRRGTAL
jgi:hypothetical protein